VTKFALLNNADHQDVRVITDHSAKYGDNVMYALTFPSEFRSVQACYPILFHNDANGNPFPVALFGFQEGENLFLGEPGWDARYVPAMIRREPFLIGYQGSEDQEDEDKARVLSIDMDHPRVSREEGQALFQPLGARTRFLDGVTELMETIYNGHIHNKAFMAALQEHELIEAVTMDITLNDGSRNQLLGFQTINEDKVQRLSGDVLEAFSRQSILMPLFMVLASTMNLRALIDRKNATLQG
jgi:hypothetical protein